MAHTVTTQVLIDGSRKKVIKVNIKGDSGAATELANYVIFDASAYANATTKNKLMEVSFCLNGFSAELFWDATSNVALINLEKDISEEMYFRKEGGLINNAGTGRTGDILITTTGLASSSNEGYIIFHITQRGVDFPR